VALEPGERALHGRKKPLDRVEITRVLVVLVDGQDPLERAVRCRNRARVQRGDRALQQTVGPLHVGRVE
jgi:hypothetical protein